ncbi:MAG: ATP-binding protein [archaeon]|nr:ATP-binding protein [Nanoarchaeota archaeon]
MVLEKIIVEEDIVKNYYSNKINYETLLRYLDSTIEVNLPKSNLGDLVEKYNILFLGTSHLIETELKNYEESKTISNNIKLLYTTLIASQVVLKEIEDSVGNAGNNVMIRSQQEYQEIDISLSRNNEEMNKAFLKGMVDSLINSKPAGLRIIKNYLNQYSKKASNVINNNLNKDQAEILKEISWKYNFHTISGNFKSKEELNKRNDQKKGIQNSDPLLKGLKDYILEEPVSRQDIVGNEDIIDLIETEVACLMHYDPVDKSNLYQGFNQFVMLAGRRGTGKTMMAMYGLTIGKSLSDKYNKDLSIIELDFEDRWQCGPELNIRAQLEEVSKSNKPYIVFIDEIDTKIPTRTESGKDSQKAVIGEILKFRGGVYLNKNNYLVLATTNRPNDVDIALRNKFEILEVPGPKNGKERTEILYKRMQKGIERGYVQINDWSNIKNILEKYLFTGRDLVNISSRAERKFRKSAKRFRCDHTTTEGKQVVQQIIQSSDYDYITTDKDLISSIMYEVQKEKIEQTDFLKQDRYIRNVTN